MIKVVRDKLAGISRAQLTVLSIYFADPIAEIGEGVSHFNIDDEVYGCAC